MKFAFADPPYLGCCQLYGHEHGEGGGRPFDGRCWNDPETHALLLGWLAEFDGWAYCLSSVSLAEVLPLVPGGGHVSRRG